MAYIRQSVGEKQNAGHVAFSARKNKDWNVWMTVRILIIDDHEVAREGLASLLKGPHISHASTSPGGTDAVEKVEADEIDAVLLDVRMPKQDGLATLEKIRAAKPDLPIVMMSAHDNPTYIARAAALGANDYVLKSDDKSRMTQALTDAKDGNSLPTNSNLLRVRQMMHRNANPPRIPADLNLTPRELQVLRHVGLGLSNKEIASSLGISVETVKEHVQNILRKIGANDRTDAAVRAVRMGLVD